MKNGGNPHPVITSPCCINITAAFAPPASWSRRKRDLALAGELFPGRKPDASNVAKLCEDSLKGVVIADDALVCDLHVIKRYAERPAVTITVFPLDGGAG